jgi:2-dehydropantoate 2-reductase
MTGPRILIVGAGAVGQVFGYHFSKAGADVWFFARNVHRFEKRLALFSRVNKPVGFEAGGWVTSPEQIARKPWVHDHIEAAARLRGLPRCRV